MHLLKGGLVKYEKFKKGGMLLITDKYLFAISLRNGAATTGGAVGGILGALIGSAVDALKNKNHQPDYLQDPDLSILDAAALKQLRASDLLVKIPIAGLVAKSKFTGFDFHSPHFPVVGWGGLAHKKTMRAFLESVHIPIEA